MKAVKIALLAAAGLLPALGFADTVSYSFNTVADNNSTPFSLGRFDTNLGTLTGVHFSYQVVSLDGATFRFDNDSSNTSVQGVVSTQLNVGTFTISDSDVAAALGGYASTLQGFHSSLFSTPALGADDGDGAGLQTGGVDYAELSFAKNQVVQAFNTDISNGADLSKFYGIAGSTFSGLTTASFSAFSGFSTSVDGQYTGSMGTVGIAGTVTYTYNAIPEPTTYAVILGALTLGLVGYRRFRK